MIRLRKECPEIGWGKWKRLPVGSKPVLALSYEHQGRRVIVLHNFSREPQSIRLRLQGKGREVLANLIQEDESRNDAGVHGVTLESYGYRWYRVGGLSFAST